MIDEDPIIEYPHIIHIIQAPFSAKALTLNTEKNISE